MGQPEPPLAPVFKETRLARLFLEETLLDQPVIVGHANLVVLSVGPPHNNAVAAPRRSSLEPELPGTLSCLKSLKEDSSGETLAEVTPVFSRSRRSSHQVYKSGTGQAGELPFNEI